MKTSRQTKPVEPCRLEAPSGIEPLEAADQTRARLRPGQLVDTPDGRARIAAFSHYTTWFGTKPTRRALVVVRLTGSGDRRTFTPKEIAA